MKRQGFKAKYYLATKLQGNIFFKGFKTKSYLETSFQK